jgi:hypothetical protein
VKEKVEQRHKWVSTDWSCSGRVTPYEVVIQYLSACTRVSMETYAYTLVYLRKGAYILRNVKNQGCIVNQELLDFEITVYSFLHFSVGHFPG